MPRKLSMNAHETVQELQELAVQIKDCKDQYERNKYAARRSRLVRHLSQASSATMVAAPSRGSGDRSTYSLGLSGGLAPRCPRNGCIRLMEGRAKTRWSTRRCNVLGSNRATVALPTAKNSL